MPRIPRTKLWTDAACYHVINRGHNREIVFTDEQDFLYFKTLLARYCPLPNSSLPLLPHEQPFSFVAATRAAADSIFIHGRHVAVLRPLFP